MHSLIVGLVLVLALVPPVLAVGIAQSQVTQPQAQAAVSFPNFAGVWIQANAGPVNSVFTASCNFAEALLTPRAFILVSATEPAYLQESTGALASTSSSQWGSDNMNGNVTLGYGFPLKIFRRFVIQGKLGQTATGRVFLGIGGCTVVNGSQANWAKDAPTAARYVQFRYSSGTDVTWKGVVSDGITQTVVDLAVIPDTNLHIFRIDYDGVKVTWFIDGVALGSLNVANFSTPIMVLNSIDNKNVAVAVTFSFAGYYYQMNR